MDGCLANFDKGFASLLHSLTGIAFPVDAPTFPEVWGWHYHHLEQAGLTKEEAQLWVNEAWSLIESDAAWWSTLSPLPGAITAIERLEELSNDGHNIYFITNRRTRTAKHQTEDWLNALGKSCPTVLLADHKGYLAEGLHLHAMIDDRPSNLYKIRSVRGTKTVCYLVNRPFNLAADERKFCLPVTTVLEALTIECPTVTRMNVGIGRADE